MPVRPNPPREIELSSVAAAYEALGRSTFYLRQAEELMGLECPSTITLDNWNRIRSHSIEIGAAYATLTIAIKTTREDPS